MPDAATYEFKPRRAKREGVGLFIGLAGGTGSGKSYSALRLARGIVGPKGRILAGDTEGRRMSHYADRFEFDAVDILPPFRPSKFEELAKYAEAEKYDVLIIDSFSHEWAGDGGVLEWHDDLTEGNPAKNMTAWIKPKGEHKGMINAFLQRRIPIIFCMRAEEKVKVLPNGKPSPMGWMPICDKNFGYELTTMVTLSNENPGKVDYKLPRKIEEQHLAILPDGQFITEAAGAKLAAWARGDDIAPVDRTTAAANALIARIDKCPTGTAVEAIFGEDTVAKQVSWMKTHRADQHDRVMKAADQRVAVLNAPATEPTGDQDQPVTEGEPAPQ